MNWSILPPPPPRRLMEKNDTYSLRGVCMLMIMIHHVYKCLVVDFNFPSNMIDLFWGDLGTGVFFFISGYGLYYSLTKQCAMPKTLFKNLKKLLIPFFITSCFSVVFILSIDDTLSLSSMLLNIATLSFPQGGAWFFKAITFIYIITIALFSLKISDEFKVFTLFFLNLVYVTVAVRILNFDSYLFGTIVNFPLGMYLASKNNGHGNIYLSIILLILLFIFSMHLNVKTSLSIKSPVFSLLAIYICAIIPISNKLLYYIGKKSLLFYLFHIAIIYPLQLLVPQWWLLVFSVFTLTFVLVYLYARVEAFLAKS